MSTGTGSKEAPRLDHRQQLNLLKKLKKAINKAELDKFNSIVNEVVHITDLESIAALQSPPSSPVLPQYANDEFMRALQARQRLEKQSNPMPLPREMEDAKKREHNLAHIVMIAAAAAVGKKPEEICSCMQGGTCKKPPP